ARGGRARSRTTAGDRAARGARACSRAGRARARRGYGQRRGGAGAQGRARRAAGERQRHQLTGAGARRGQRSAARAEYQLAARRPRPRGSRSRPRWGARAGVSGALVDGDAQRLQECVAGGGVAVFPTDTVYGLCCDPQDEAAARRLYALKGRPPARACAVMFFELEPALRMLEQLREAERLALRALLPGPVTVLLPNRERHFAAAF